MTTNPAPGQPAPAAPARQYTCNWCGTVSEGTTLNCPSCGASLDVRLTVTESGWAEVPGRRDMAKIQMGSSVLQIEGAYVPVADYNLAAGDTVYFTHHVLLWQDPQVAITVMSLKGGWKRMFAGLPLIMTQATGPGHIAFSHDAPGELITVPIQPGQAVDVREHIFMVANSHVTYDWFKSNIWFTTRTTNSKGETETETHYPLGMFMDRFAVPAGQKPGLLLLQAAGNVFVRRLQPGQTILVKPTALVFKDPTVQMQLHFERPNAAWNVWGSWGNRYMWLRLQGPGRVAVQSVFDSVEGEGGNISNYSPATETRW
jgi:uncharacterized protein (AIM24 family)